MSFSHIALPTSTPTKVTNASHPIWIQHQFEEVTRRLTKPDPKGDNLYFGVYGIAGLFYQMIKVRLDPADPATYAGYNFERQDIDALYNELCCRWESAGKTVDFTAYSLPEQTFEQLSRPNRITYLKMLQSRDAQTRVKWNMGPWD